MTDASYLLSLITIILKQNFTLETRQLGWHLGHLPPPPSSICIRGIMHVLSLLSSAQPFRYSPLRTMDAQTQIKSTSAME